jgi:hypothetical protein
MNTKVVHSIHGATVEVTDRVQRAETPDEHPYAPDSKHYERVDFLSNGWVRCISDDGRDEDSDQAEVDYYPPQLVNGVWTLEEVENID